MKDEKKTNNSHQDKSDQFRTEIESKMIDLDGPELLQFAMIFVQGALKKSQVQYLNQKFAGASPQKVLLGSTFLHVNSRDLLIVWYRVDIERGS